MIEAAEALGVTESAVSHQIRHLEDLLHVPLFERTAAGLKLTDVGQGYLTGIDPALRALEDATAAVRPRQGRAAVRLTAPPSFVATWLIPRLGGFEAAHSDIEVQLVATTRVIDLRREQVDAAIRYGKGSWPGVDVRFLFEDQANPVAAPGYLTATDAAPSEVLAKARLIVNRSVPDEWQEWARARGIAPPPLDNAMVLDSIEQVLHVAEAGHGLAMGRAPYIEARLAQGSLVTPFGQAGPTGAAYYFCVPADRTPTAAVRKLERWLVAEAQTGKT